MKFDELNDDNFLFFAAKSYYNPRCNNVDDFYEDLNRIRYIKRSIARYKEVGKISERLLLNHVIVFANSFSIPATLKMFEYKFDESSWEVLKPILIRLNYIKDDQYPNIESDKYITRILEEI